MRTTIRACASLMLWTACAWPVVAICADPQTQGPDQWRAVVMRDAIESAQAIQDPYRAGEAFAAIARGLIAMGDEAGAEASLRTALAKVSSIQQAEFRGWVQHEIVQVQLALNDLIGAQQTTAAIAADRPQGAAYVLLARRALQSGNIASAESLAAAIRESSAAGEILSEIVAAKVSKGELTAARTIQRGIEDPQYAAIAQGYVAIGEARAGSLDRARDAVLKTSRSQRTQAVGQLVTWTIERGDALTALRLAGDIDDTMRRAPYVARLALDSRRGGDDVRARELFAASLKLVGASKGPTRQRLLVLIQIARLQALAGFTADASATLELVLQDLPLASGPDRDLVLEGVARTYVRMTDFDRAVSTGAQIQDRVSRALLIRDIAALQAAAGTPAAEIVRREWTEDPLAITAAHFGILGSRLGEPARTALSTIEATRDQVARIDDPLLRPAALASLAAASVRAGDVVLGGNIFAELRATTARIERADQRAFAYVRSASALNDRLIFLGRPANPPEACSVERADCSTR